MKPTNRTAMVNELDQLRDHYKHCIRLSASNKINPKNAFDLQLIDYMQDLVSTTEDGQMNFKIASSALDVGAKIYSSRVDCIQSEAQKVASSILMALDGQQKGGKNPDDTQMNGDTSAGSDRLDDSHDEENAQAKATKKKKSTRNKNVKTIVEDTSLLDAKIEKIVLGDPYLDGLSQDYDMSCPAALICYNALTQPSCLLTIESGHLRKNYQELSSLQQSSAAQSAKPVNLETIVEENTEDSSINDANHNSNSSIKIQMSTNASSTTKDNYNMVTLITKSFNCAEIIRQNQNNQICPRLENFLFNDRTTKIVGLSSNPDESFNLDPTSNDNQEIHNSSKTNGGAHEFNPDLYNNAGNDDFDDDHFEDAQSVIGNQDDEIENDLKKNLDKIAASKPTDYGYSNEQHRLLNTWAGPHAWKALKLPQTVKKGPPKSARKKVKLEQKPIDFFEEILASLEVPADKDIRLSSEAIRRWKKPLLPQDHNLTEEKILQTVIQKAFHRPEDTYHCMQSPADALKLVDGDHDYTKADRLTNGVQDAGNVTPMSPGGSVYAGFDDDCDDDFPATNPAIGKELTLYGGDPLNRPNNTLAHQQDLEFAGENLIDQPYTVPPLNIPFAKVVKKMDVKQLKHVMCDLLSLTNRNDPQQQQIQQPPQNQSITANSTVVSGDEQMNETVIDVATAKKTPSPTLTDSMVHLEFSKLYCDIPEKLIQRVKHNGQRMVNDLSQPIAFVTLLHVANENNLRLIPTQDLKDFVIEQDDFIVTHN